MILEEITTEAVFALATRIAGPDTKDKLLKAARSHPQAPKLSRIQRCRLGRLVSAPEAMDAMRDRAGPAEAQLSALIARDVFKEAETPRSNALATILIIELPGCLPTQEARTLTAYRLRSIDQRIEGLGNQVTDIAADVREVGGGVDQANQTLSELRDLLISREQERPIDPEVLINGPLKALNLEHEYASARSLEATNPGAAAARLTNVIDLIAASGHANQTGPFVRYRAQLLSRAGDPNAVEAWLPVVDQLLTSGGGLPSLALAQPLQDWRSIADQANSPTWLSARIAAVEAIEDWYTGDVEATELLERAINSDDAGDPAAIRWLVRAAEACLVTHQETFIIGARSRLVAAANRSDDVALSARLLIAVADTDEDDELWDELLANASPAGERYQADVSGLIHARRARKLYGAGRDDEALSEFRLAYEHAARALNWADAAEWATAAVYIMNEADSIIVDDLSALQEREEAFRAAGGGSLLAPSLDDLHLSALTYLTESQTSNRNYRSTRNSLRRYESHSLVLGAVTHELSAHDLSGRFWMQLDDANSAIGHFIIAADVDRAVKAAAGLTRYHDCHEYVGSGRARQRATALRVAAEEADLIPDDQVTRWATVALAEAHERDFSLTGPGTYGNAYRLIEGLAPRFPTDLVDALLNEISQLLPRRRHTYTPVDDQIANILVRLGAYNTSHREAIAACIATAFELTDDIAADIARHARSLTDVLLAIRDRLLAVLNVAASEPGQIMKLMNVTMTLVQIGDTSPALLQSAEGFVSRALGRPLAYSENSVSRIAWVEEPAVIAKCLPVERRIDLARDYLQRALDTNDIEANRASYAVAFVNLGPHLPDEVRNDIFDQLLPLAGEPQPPTNYFDIMEQQFRNPLGPRRITSDTGRLRRFALKALAVVATDANRQQRVWRAAQRLIVSGQKQDSVTVANVGYELSARGFAPELPWLSMAYSADREMRQLAGALIPFLPTLDYEGVSSLAADDIKQVRCELAFTLKKLAQRGDLAASDQEHVSELIARLRNDTSFRVRSALPPNTDG